MLLTVVLISCAQGARAERINADMPPAKKEAVFRLDGRVFNSASVQAALQRKLGAYVSDVSMSRALISQLKDLVSNPRRRYFEVEFKVDNGSGPELFSGQMGYDREASDEEAFTLFDCQSAKYKIVFMTLSRQDVLGFSKPQKQPYPIDNRNSPYDN